MLFFQDFGFYKKEVNVLLIILNIGIIILMWIYILEEGVLDMANIFDYIKWRGDLSIRQDSFNEVDGIILSAFSYLPFELVYDKLKFPAKIKDICKALADIPDISKKLLFKNDLSLIKSLINCKRFGSMLVSDYENFVDTNSQTQFSAVTIKIRYNQYCIAFRGTDNTIVGWKEDFNMAFVCPVPAQEAAVAYLDNITSKFSGNFIICGHSKGGNLAIYASAFSTKKSNAQIDMIYNYDGPGFDARILTTDEYKEICGKICSFVPQSSIVGMLFNHEDEYTIVKSSQISILQHDFYSWNIEGKNFIYLDEVTKGSKFIDTTLKSWLESVDYKERERFIDTVFSVLEETKARTIREMGENWLKSAKAITKSIQNIDEDTKTAVTATLKLLAECVKQNALLANPIDKIRLPSRKKIK